MPTTYRVLSDTLYRSVALVTTANVVTEAYDTDAYGNTLCYSGSGTDGDWFTDDDVRTNNPINTTIFTGRQYDLESQIYYYRARYYSPQIVKRLIKALWVISCILLANDLIAEDASTLAQQGEVASKERDYDHSIDLLSKAIQINPDSEELFYLRGSAYTHRSEESKSPADLDSAIADDNQALKLNPSDARVLSNRGLAYIYKGDFGNATKDLNSSIQLDPNFSPAYINLGLKYEKSTGDEKNAISEYNRAIEINSADIKAYTLRSAAFLSIRKLEESISDASNAIRLDPSNTEAIHTRAVAFYAKKDFRSSIRDFELIIQIDPSNSVAYSSLAWILATSPENSLRDGHLAVRYATKACDLTKWKDPKTIEVLAAALAESGDFDKAIYWENSYLKTPNLAIEKVKAAQNRLNIYYAHKPFRS